MMTIYDALKIWDDNNRPEDLLIESYKADIRWYPSHYYDRYELNFTADELLVDDWKVKIYQDEQWIELNS